MLNCNPTCTTPIFDNLVTSTGASNLFSVCLTNNGGYWMVGYIDEDMHTAPPSYVPYTLLFDSGYYGIDVLDIQVDTVSVMAGTATSYLNVKQVGIVDTGSTHLILGPETYASLIGKFKQYHYNLPGVLEGSVFGGACLSTRPDPTQWPVLTFVFSGVTLSITSDLYFIEYSHVQYCWGISEVR